MAKFKVGDNVTIRVVKTVSFNEVETIEEVITYEDGTIYKLIGDGASYEEHELEKYEVETSIANKLREKSEAILRARREEENKRVQERLGGIVEHIISECGKRAEEGKFQAFFYYSMFLKESDDKYVDSKEVDKLLMEAVVKELKKEGFVVTENSMGGSFVVSW